MNNFVKALKKAVSIIPRNVSHPILGATLLKGNGEDLNIFAIGNDISVKITIDCDFKLDCCVNGKLLCDFLQSIKGNVKLEQTEQSLMVYSDNNELELPIISSQEFPSFPELMGSKISVLASDLKNAFKKVDFVPTRDWYEPFKASVLFDYQYELLKIVASDDHRLGVFGTIVEVREKIADRKVLISKDTVLNLEKTLPDDGEINIYFAKNGIFWEDKNGETVFTRLVNGEFPDYEKVLPKDETTYCSFEIKREEFMQSLNRVSLIADIAQIKARDNLEILGESEKGKIKEVVEIFDNKGNIEANYNVQYLLQPLSRMDDKTIQIKVGNYNILSFNVEQYIYVLSPVEGEDKNA